MTTTDLDRTVAALGDAVAGVRQAMLHVEIGHCDITQLAAVKQSATTLATLADVLKTDVAVRADELRHADTSDVVDTTLNPNGRGNPRDELIEKDRAGVLGNLPGLDTATRSGELSARYADIVAKALGKLSADVVTAFYQRHHDLDQLAATMSVHGFRLHVAHLVELIHAEFGVKRAERQRHQRKASTFIDPETAMFGLSGRWDPLTGQRLNTVITAELNAIYHTRRDDPADLRTRDQILADAITNLICDTPTTSRTRVTGATVVVICDQQTATTGPHPGSVHEYGDGSPVAFDTLHHLLTDPTTNMIDATVNEHGVVQTLGDAELNHGRNRRFATRVQKLALRVMHRNCIFPGCDIAFDRCEQHHLIEYRHHGRTDLLDLGPTCTRHHHQLHTHNWNLHLHPNTRQLTITYPDGTTRTHPFTGLAPPHDNNPPGNHPPGNDPPGSDPPGEPTGNTHDDRPAANDHAPPPDDDHPPPPDEHNPTNHGDAA